MDSTTTTSTTTTTTTTTATATTNVQHVTKKSSDELLRKFADPDADEVAKKVPKRRRRSRESGGGDHDHDHQTISCESPYSSNGQSSSLVERRSLLPLAPVRKSALLRQLGIRGRAHLRAREIRHKSLFGAIEKTWRRTIEGASKVFMEKQYNRHRRLINDMV